MKKHPKKGNTQELPKNPGPNKRLEIDLEKAMKAQPAWLRTELEGLKKHENEILRSLKEDANRELFISDAPRFLKKLNLPISGALAARLRGDASWQKLKQGVCFKLPNGQTVTPRVRINFTKEG